MALVHSSGTSSALGPAWNGAVVDASMAIYFAKLSWRSVRSSKSIIYVVPAGESLCARYRAQHANDGVSPFCCCSISMDPTSSSSSAWHGVTLQIADDTDGEDPGSLALTFIFSVPSSPADSLPGNVSVSGTNGRQLGHEYGCTGTRPTTGHQSRKGRMTSTPAGHVQSCGCGRWRARCRTKTWMTHDGRPRAISNTLESPLRVSTQCLTSSGCTCTYFLTANIMVSRWDNAVRVEKTKDGWMDGRCMRVVGTYFTLCRPSIQEL